MTSEDTPPNKTAAWVTNFDDLRCLEASTASKAAWLKSLHLGCLNQSVREKLRVYSHLRSLSSKLIIPASKNETRGRRHTIHLSASEVEIDELTREQEEVEESKQRPLSLVILEDYSGPPQAKEEVTPLLFTSTAFFHYLYSDNWGGQISIRVINGELLDLLLAALCSLEMQFRVDSNIVYASLNNRSKVCVEEDSQQQDVVEKPTTKASEYVPKSYEPRKEFVYDKINVEIVFYEKTEVSNVPYVLHETDSSDRVSQVPMQRDVARFPYALHQHEMNYVRLPASEDVDIKNIILTLQDELKELKAGETPPKDAPAQQRVPEKMNAGSDKVEWIAEDPYLVPVHHPSGASDDRSDRVSQTIMKTQHRPSQSVSETANTTTSTAEGLLAKEITYLASKHFSLSELEGEEEEDIYIQSVKSSEGSYVIISSPAEFAKEDDEAVTLKKLNLTRNELYVAGLYSPRKENALSLKEKLKSAQQIRCVNRIAKEKDIYEKLKKSVPFDIADRFKCLAATKNDAKKTIAAQSSKKSKMPKPSFPASFSLWDEYSKDQEDMEMDSALINDVERGILSRMMTSKGQNLESEPEVRGKGMKNKSKNNPDERDVSPTNPNKEQLLQPNQQISKNCNTSATTEINTRCKSSAKCELPSISNKMKKAKKMIGHDSKHTVTLPPLLQNKSQEKHVRYRIDENIPTCNTVINSGPQADGMGNKMTASDSKSKKQSNNNWSQFEKICKDNSLRKDSVHNANKRRKGLPSRKSAKRSNRNRNQNNVSISDQEEEVHADNPVEDKELKTKTPETVSTPESSTYKSELVKSGDSYDELLQQYRYECVCEECKCLTEQLRHETAEKYEKTCPLFLGRLSRDFKFLKYADYEPKEISTCTDTLFKLPEINHQFVCDNVLKLMETVMIRKEIITSSLGYRYITITFTKQ